jgi:hypothetical protein
MDCKGPLLVVPPPPPIMRNRQPEDRQTSEKFKIQIKIPSSFSLQTGSIGILNRFDR